MKLKKNSKSGQEGIIKIARHKSNLVRFKYLSLIGLVFGGLLLFRNTFMPSIAEDDIFYTAYRYLFITIASLGFTGLFFLKFSSQSKTVFQQLGMYTIVFGYIVAAQLITLVDLSYTFNLTSYITILLFFNILFRSGFLMAISYHVISALIIFSGVNFIPNHQLNYDYMDMISLTIFCFLVWIGQEKLWRSSQFTKIKLENKIQDEENARAELQQLQKKLVNHAHKAGMSEIATDTMHNIGNILNSVKTSTTVIEGVVSGGSINAFSKACDLIRESATNPDDFDLAPPKKSLFYAYLLKFEKTLKSSNKTVQSEVERLTNKIDMITEVIQAQQNYAGATTFKEVIEFKEVIDEALAVVPELGDRTNIFLTKKIPPNIQLNLPKNKLLHTLINLLKNAAHALIYSDTDPKKITISLEMFSDIIKLKISDNGYGIAKNNMGNIFKHGFTTKETGHGFGLHSCANYIEEMGARIEVDSQGVGTGATFTIYFPITSLN